MVQIIKSNCPSCGAPLTLPSDLEKLNCTACGSSLIVEFGDGYYTLKSAEEIAKAIQQSGTATRDAILENTYVTKSELQRLQLSQELSSAQIQLTNIESEIRLLLRGPKSKVSTRQIGSLSFGQYQALDRIRILQKQINTPQPDDLQGLQNLLEWENDWYQKEISALVASDRSDRLQLMQSLSAQVAWNKKRILSIKTEFIKRQCRSLQVEDPSPEDSSKINSLLILLNEDEQRIRPYRFSPEGSDLYNQIKNRQSSIWDMFQRNERDRFSRLSSLSATSTDFGSKNDIQEQLEQIEQDLLTLRNSFESEAKREYEHKLLLRKSTLLRLQKDQERIERNAKRASKIKMIVGGIGAAFAAMISGIVLLVNKLITRKGQNPTEEKTKVFSMGLKSESVSENLSKKTHGSEKNNFETPPPIETPLGIPQQTDSTFKAETMDTTEREEVAASPSIPLEKTSQEVVGEPVSKSLGIGFLQGFLSFMGLMIGFVILMSSLFRTESSSSAATGLFLVLISLGVAFSGYIFLRRAFMPIKIDRLGKSSSFVIRKKNSQFGSTNQGLAKTSIFIITLICTYLLFMGILMFFNTSSSGVMTVIFLLGIIAGPVVAWQVSKRSAIINAASLS